MKQDATYGAMVLALMRKAWRLVFGTAYGVLIPWGLVALCAVLIVFFGRALGSVPSVPEWVRDTCFATFDLSWLLAIVATAIAIVLALKRSKTCPFGPWLGLAVVFAIGFDFILSLVALVAGSGPDLATVRARTSEVSGIPEADLKCVRGFLARESCVLFEAPPCGLSTNMVVCAGESIQRDSYVGRCMMFLDDAADFAPLDAEFVERCEIRIGRLPYDTVVSLRDGRRNLLLFYGMTAF